MKLREKLIALFACATLVASFVPAAAIADTASSTATPSGTSSSASSTSSSSAKANTPSVKTQNTITTQNATTNSLTITFKDSYDASQGKVQYSLDNKATWVDVTADVNAQAIAVTGDDLILRIIPADGYEADFSGTSYREDAGAPIPVAGDAAISGGLLGQNGYHATPTATSVALEGVEFKAQGGGPEHTREVTVTIDDASLPILAPGKMEMKVGYGDDNDVAFTKNGATLTVDASTTKKIIISFIVNKKYFVPTAIVNGKTFETTDTGEHPSPDVTVLCVELRDKDANVDDFVINLSIGAVANVDLKAKSVDAASAKYMMVEEGKAVMDDADVDLAIADAAVDSSIDNAVATFDLGLKINDKEASTIDSPLAVNMKLDTDVYTASGYDVVRNHEGKKTKLDAKYDAKTGILSFESDQYSDYTLVDKDKSTADSTNKSSLAKTGDPLAAVPFGFAGAAALAAAGAAYALRRSRQE